MPGTRSREGRKHGTIRRRWEIGDEPPTLDPGRVARSLSRSLLVSLCSERVSICAIYLYIYIYLCIPGALFTIVTVFFVVEEKAPKALPLCCIYTHTLGWKVEPLGFAAGPEQQHNKTSKQNEESNRLKRSFSRRDLPSFTHTHTHWLLLLLLGWLSGERERESKASTHTHT